MDSLLKIEVPCPKSFDPEAECRICELLATLEEAEDRSVLGEETGEKEG